MLLTELVDTSNAVQAASGRLDKTARIAALLTRLAPDEIEIAVTFLSGAMRQGRVGIGWAAIRAAASTPAAETPSITLHDVDRTLGQIASARGGGSSRARAGLLTDLLSRATRPEQDFLVRLLHGELRQGALEGVMVDAVAKAAVHVRPHCGAR